MIAPFDVAIHVGQIVQLRRALGAQDLFSSVDRIDILLQNTRVCHLHADCRIELLSATALSRSFAAIPAPCCGTVIFADSEAVQFRRAFVDDVNLRASFHGFLDAQVENGLAFVWV